MSNTQSTRKPSGAIERRRFLQTSVMAAGATMLNWRSRAAGEDASSPSLHRWFAQFPVPRELWVLRFSSDSEEGMILESAAGLAALALLQRKWATLIYEDLDNDGYQRWFKEFCQTHSPKLMRMSLDEAVERLRKAQVVSGYILFRFEQSDRPLHSAGKLDESANVATSLASGLNALVVSERLAPRMEKLGLKQLLDVRERTEQWCLSERDFSRAVVGTADPKMRNVRSLMIALNAFVCSGKGPAYQKALARCQEDVPVLGWGCDLEDGQTLTSSRLGLFQTATDWCHNLPVFASDVIGESIPANKLRDRHPLHWSALDWGEGVHHVNFTLSDGDNVQWVMGNFIGGSEPKSYYANPKRGRIPFTWGLPVPSLCQLSPRTLAEILTKATPNDDFIQFQAGGYFYPDCYGKARGTTKALELHAERLRAYIDLTGIRILAFNFQDWDGAAARTACEIFASKLPGLLGIFAFQYYPYSAGGGVIHWVRGVAGDEVPIVSCRFTIWAQTGRPRDSTPAAIAASLNGLPVAHDVATDACFSWIMAHAWSRFRSAGKGMPLNAEEKDVPQDKETPDTTRGYEPVLWAAERLRPEVKAVTAQELLWRIRLRLRPHATLSLWLTEVERSANPPAGKIQEARTLLAASRHDAISARRCFELLKALHRDRVE